MRSINEYNQDIFNRVWKNFVVDKMPQSKNTSSICCVYAHSAKSNGCAIGCLIPKEKINPEWDSAKDSSVDAIYQNYSDFRTIIGKLYDGNVPDLIFLGRLQSIHDGYFDVLSEKMTELALNLDLQIPPNT